MWGRLLEKLTVWHLKLGDSKLERKISYTYGNLSKEIYVFSSASKTNAQATPWGTIIMPSALFEKYSKNVIDLFFLHEYGHTRKPRINFLFYLVLVPLGLIFLASSLSTISLLILFFSGLHAYAFLQWSILLTTITALATIGISWASEGNAELFALRSMGKHNYLVAMSEMKTSSVSKPKQNPIMRAFFQLIRRVMYPPRSVVMFFYDNSK
jgi:hypothetical protein